MLSSKSDTHAELAKVSTQARELAVSEASARHRLEQADALRCAAEERERALRRAAIAAADGQQGGNTEPTGSMAQRISDRMLLKQREQILEMQQQIDSFRVTEQLSNAREMHDAAGSSFIECHASGLQQKLSSASAQLDAALAERNRLAAEIKALRAREEARNEGIETELADANALHAALHDVREAALQEQMHLEAAHLTELGAAQLAALKARGAEDELATERATWQLRDARAQAELRQAQREASDAAKAAAIRHEELVNEAHAAHALAEKRSLEAMHAESVAKERSVQIAILTETVEAMQGGGEAEERVASISAQLSACQSVQAHLSRRLHEQQLLLEGATARVEREAAQLLEATQAQHSLHAEIGALRAEVERRTTEATSLQRQLHTLQAELRQVEERCSHGDRHAALLEAKHEATHAQLSLQQERHATQLKRERSEHSTLVRSLQEKLLEAGEALDAAASFEGASRMTGPGKHTGTSGGSDTRGPVPAEQAHMRAVRQQLLLLVQEVRLHVQMHGKMPPARNDSQSECGTSAAQSSAAQEQAAASREKAGAAATDPSSADLLDGMQTLLIKHNELLGKELARAGALAMQLDIAQRKLEVVEPAIERHVVARDIAKKQLLMMHRHIAERTSLQEGSQAAQLRARDGRVAALEAQLEEAASSSLRLEQRVAGSTSEVAWLRQELQVSKAAFSSCSQSITTDAALSRPAVDEQTTRAEAESEERVSEFFQKHVLRGLALASGLSDRESCLLRDVAAHKLAQERLADQLGASERRYEVARTQMISLQEALRASDRECVRLRASSAEAGGDQSISHSLQAERNSALAAAAAYKRRAEKAEFQAQQASLALEQVAQSQRLGEDGQVALQDVADRRIRQVQDKLRADAHAAHEELWGQLLQERAMHGRALRLQQQQATADLQCARDAWAQERSKMHSTLEVLGSRVGLPPGVGLHQFQEKAQTLARENQRLVTKTAAMEQQLHATQGELEVREAAIQGLESSLAAVQSLASAPAKANAVGTHAAIARQLIRIRLSEASLRRKLRVAARAEVALHAEVAARDKRLRDLRGSAGSGVELSSPNGLHQGLAEASLSSASSLRLQLARLRGEVAQLQRELAEERSKGGAEHDVDLQRMFERLSTVEQKNRQLSRGRSSAERHRRSATALVPGAAEERVSHELHERAKQQQPGAPSALAELRERGVLGDSAEENVEVLVEAVHDLSAQLAALEDPSTAHKEDFASPFVVDRLSRQLQSEQQQCAQLRAQLMQALGILCR